MSDKTVDELIEEAESALAYTNAPTADSAALNSMAASLLAIAKTLNERLAGASHE